MKRERAYVEGRRKQILALMKENPAVRVDELAEKFQVSLITIRRDLQYLEEKNLLVRFYGGAVSAKAEKKEDGEINVYRNLIAKYAASLVEPGDSLFINSSRNALQILKYINCDNVTVITNNGKAIHTDYPEGISVLMTGGELRHPKDAMVGDFAIRNLQTVFPKKAFVGCSGISPMSGMTTEIAAEVKINELMIQNATKDVYVLADHTKIGKNSSFTSAAIGQIGHLITDEKAPQDVLKQLEKMGVQVHQVKAEKEAGGVSLESK